MTELQILLVVYLIAVSIVGLMAFKDMKPMWEDDTLKRWQLLMGLVVTFVPPINIAVAMLLAFVPFFWVGEKLFKLFKLAASVRA